MQVVSFKGPIQQFSANETLLDSVCKNLSSFVLKNSKTQIELNYLETRSIRIQKTVTEWKDFDETAIKRNIFSIEFQNIFSELGEKLGIKNLHLLEIGCGKLLNNHSYLSNKFTAASWTFSDFYDFKIPQANFIKLDLVNSSARSTKCKFDCIIGSNVLDTISYDKLDRVFQNFSKLLKPNGTCVHVANVAFYFDSFYHHIANELEDCVYLPGSTLNQIYKISNDNFFNTLKTASITELEKHIYTYWGTQKNAFQVFATLTSHLETNISSLGARNAQIFGPHLQLITISQVFERSLIAAAKKNNFDVETCEVKYSVGSYPNWKPEGYEPTKEDTNYEYFKQGYFKKYRCYVLLPNTYVQYAEMHTFVARKKG